LGMEPDEGAGANFLKSSTELPLHLLRRSLTGRRSNDVEPDTYAAAGRRRFAPDRL
jgi:hypothetical protein